jgi:trans-aconitate methyltransferase
MSEIDKLNRISNDFSYSSGVMDYSIKYSYAIFLRHHVSGSILEFGPAEGSMTKLIIEDFNDIELVEGSTIFCDALRKLYPSIKIHNCLFEDFSPNRKFDNIILGHVLEHVTNPIEILLRVKTLLNPGGIIFAAVPNSSSIHRQAAVLMGMLPKENSLNDSDINHGHRLIFNVELFHKIFIESNLEIIKYGGYWLKPISNKQIEDSWNKNMIEAFMSLGEKFPDISAEIYVVASLKE